MAAADQLGRGRAFEFTMAMLQRRMAPSIYAVRRSLERMRTRREKILADPEAYRQEQIQRKMPKDFDEFDAEQINFDIPWNPVRLVQRIGRIHRYGQEKDCLIFNFVVLNTREGRVLRKLHNSSPI